jgi:hypothetical protein
MKLTTMKGKTILLLLSFTITISSIGQQVKEEENSYYGPHSTKTTTISTDERLNRVVTVEYKAAGGELRRKKTYRKNLGNTWEITDTCYSKQGKAIDDEKYVFDSNNKLVAVKSEKTYIKNSEGKFVDRENTNRVVPDFRVEQLEIILLKDIKEVEKELMPSIPDTPAPCEKQQSCIPKMQLFGGYSYLNADYGTTRESFPLGAQASFVVNLSPHIGVGPDISFHTKTIDDETLTRMFFLAKAQYNFGSSNPTDSFYIPDVASTTCPRKIVPDLHVYIGLSTDRSVIKIGDDRFTTSGSGFTFGAGVGAHINLNKNIGLGLQADWLGTKFKDNDEINSDIRASAGAFFNMGSLSHELKFGRGHR